MVSRGDQIYPLGYADTKRYLLPEQQPATQPRTIAAVEIAVMNGSAETELGEKCFAERQLPALSRIGLVRRIGSAGHAELNAGRRQDAGKPGLGCLERCEIQVSRSDDAVVRRAVTVDQAAGSEPDFIDRADCDCACRVGQAGR
jgi:hypothetical protein